MDKTIHLCHPATARTVTMKSRYARIALAGAFALLVISIVMAFFGTEILFMLRG
jgi:hypothetical protein